MLHLLSDENFQGPIIDGLLRREPSLDLVRVQDVGLMGANDSDILAWAAKENRILLTHDLRTVPPLAAARVRAGQPMPGVFLVSSLLSVGQAIDDILILVFCSLEKEWEGQILYLPL